ncbi:MAG: YdgA family protein [Pseudomonadota bacterium]
MKNYLIAAVVLILLLVAAPWGIGVLAEKRVNGGLDELVETAPYLAIVERKWQRGWFTSEQEVTFEVLGPWLRALNSKTVMDELGKAQAQLPPPSPQADESTPVETPAPGEAAASAPDAAASEAPPAEPAAAEIAPIRFTVRNHILHGPVLWFSGFGIARIDSQLVLPETVRAELQKVFGEKSPLQVSTRVHFFGGGTTTFSGDARKLELAGKGHSLSYDAFKVNIGYSAHVDDVEVDGSWPRLEIVDNEKGARILMEGAAITGTSHRVRGDLYDGDFDLSIETSRVTGADKQVTEVADLHYAVDTTIDDDFMDIALKIGSGAVKAKEIEQLGVSFDEVHYDFTVRRLHVDTLVKMTKAIKASYATPVTTAAELDAAITQPMKEYGLALLKHDPELVIDRIGVATPDGDGYIKGIIKLKGVNEGDLSAGVMGMLGKLEADIRIEMAQKLVGKLPGGPGAVATALEQGYIKREREQIVSRIEFKQGVLKINGKEQGIPGLGPPKVGFESEPTPQPE